MEETNIKAVEKEVDYNISVKNNFWNATALTIAGTLGLAFLPNSILKLGLAVTGVVFIFVFINGYFARYNRIQCLIDMLKEMR